MTEATRGRVATWGIVLEKTMLPLAALVLAACASATSTAGSDQAVTDLALADYALIRTVSAYATYCTSNPPIPECQRTSVSTLLDGEEKFVAIVRAARAAQANGDKAGLQAALAAGKEALPIDVARFPTFTDPMASAALDTLKAASARFLADLGVGRLQ